MKKIIKQILLWFVAVFFGGAILTVFVFIYLSIFLPPVDQLENVIVGQSTRIYDRTGQHLIYEIYEEERRIIIPTEEIPDLAKKATIAIEDVNFYQHPAFDIRGIARALLVGILQGGRFTQGGSTITQQLIKNAFLAPDRSLIRKIRELILAYRIESLYTKDQILVMYLNQIPYGQNAYGIEAAANVFFNKSAKELNLSEIAMLTALPKAPSYYSPWGFHTEKLERRRLHVLNRMRQLDFINEEQFTFAVNNKPKVVDETKKDDFLIAPHFVVMVRSYLNQKYGEGFLKRAGLRIITTLDVELQKIANKAVSEGAKENTKRHEGHNASLIAQDAQTGHILALVGSKGYLLPSEPLGCQEGRTCRFEGRFNVAVQGLRQPGSALKPFGYLVAFVNGLTPDTIVFDVPTEFTVDNPRCPSIVNFNNTNPECYHPQNPDLKFRGPISLKNALGQSLNLPSVKVLHLAGLRQTVELMGNFGITTLKDYNRFGLSLILGGGEVRLSELVNAYSTLAQEGVKREQVFIIKIKDSDGKILEEHEDKPRKVIEEQYPRLINDILSSSRLRTPLFRGALPLTEVPPHQVALKTGTSQKFIDSWAIGYTPNLVAGVWVGNNNREPLNTRRGIPLASLPIWHEFMNNALKNKPVQLFNKPNLISADNPILRGEFDRNNPRDILSHLNLSSDPQYRNWEEATAFWLKRNSLPLSFGEPMYTYKPSLKDLTPAEGEISYLNINFIKPKSGDFIKDEVNVNALISSKSNIVKIELYFNKELVGSQFGNFSKNYSYEFRFRPSKINLQNSLVLKATSQSDVQTTKEIIIFKQN
ncbi:MAG: transglycosylase domain-containing protein [Candidatus Liptonbacteria bacterium]|nr:transglycosylase domain-containing protein [Candidatus Liptonbacteria bacterium]